MSDKEKPERIYYCDENDETGEQHWYDDPAATVRHRLEGPAVWVPATGYKEFWIFGTRYETEEQYNVAVEDYLRVEEVHGAL